MHFTAASTLVIKLYMPYLKAINFRCVDSILHPFIACVCAFTNPILTLNINHQNRFLVFVIKVDFVEIIAYDFGDTRPRMC